MTNDKRREAVMAIVPDAYTKANARITWSEALALYDAGAAHADSGIADLRAATAQGIKAWQALAEVREWRESMMAENLLHPDDVRPLDAILAKLEGGSDD